MKKRKSNWIFAAVMIVFCGLLCLIPEQHQTVYSTLPRVQVRIDAVNNDELIAIGIVYTGTQTCEVTVLTGEHRGSTTTATNYMNAALDKDKLFAPGDIGYALIQATEASFFITLIDHYRGNTELWIIPGALGGADHLRRHCGLRRADLACGQHDHHLEAAHPAAAGYGKPDFSVVRNGDRTHGVNRPAGRRVHEALRRGAAGVALGHVRHLHPRGAVHRLAEAGRRGYPLPGSR